MCDDMRTIGIVCEYNPLHNGHKYLLEQAKAHSDGQYVICVISSNFLQRGEPSLISKFERAKLAIQNGADLVFELPTIYSCRNASEYAHYSVNLLHKLGICDTLIFGSESGDISKLDEISDVLIKEPTLFKHMLKENLSKGLSFPKARSLALEEYMNNNEISTIVKSSNNILAIEYINAIKKLSSPINYSTVKRVGSNYLDEKVVNSFSSATAIRKSIFDSTLDSIKSQVPKSTFDLLTYTSNNKKFVSSNNLDNIINYKLRSLSISDFSKYQNVKEGIENRIIEMINKSLTFEEMVNYLSTKRYPKTRIRRLLTHLILQLDSEIYNNDIKYARLLYSSEKGKDLFNIINKNTLIPVFTSYKKFYDISPTRIKKLLDFEVKSTNIYESLRNGQYNTDYKHKFEII